MGQASDNFLFQLWAIGRSACKESKFSSWTIHCVTTLWGWGLVNAPRESSWWFVYLRSGLCNQTLKLWSRGSLEIILLTTRCLTIDTFCQTSTIPIRITWKFAFYVSKMMCYKVFFWLIPLWRQVFGHPLPNVQTLIPQFHLFHVCVLANFTL